MSYDDENVFAKILRGEMVIRFMKMNLQSFLWI